MQGALNAGSANAGAGAANANANAGAANANANANANSQAGGRRKTRNSKPAKKASKASKKTKKTRKLSPALTNWNERVMTVFRRERTKNPKYQLMDAMKQAKKEQ